MVTSDTYYYTTTLGWAEATDDVTAQANITYRVYYSTNPNFDTVAKLRREHLLILLQQQLI